MKNILSKLKFLCIFSITIVFLFSCSGTRSVTTEKHSNIEIQNSYLESSKIVLGNSFTYTPFDSAKPMIIDSIVYKNVIIKSDKSQTFETYKHFNIYHHLNIDNKKQTEKKDNTILWIGLSFVVCLFVFLWFYLPKIKY